MSNGWGEGGWGQGGWQSVEEKAVFEGWGAGGWGESAWGQVAGINTGATASVGSVTTTSSANVSATGVSATGGINGVLTTQSGVSATGSVGSVTATSSVELSVTGVSGTASVGTATVDGESDVTVTGLSATADVGSVTTTSGTDVSVTGVSARGNPELAGALHAEYFVPTESGSPNVKVMAFEDNTTVSSDGSSLGTISSAGGTLTVSASDYENKLISADKPITLQNSNNETTGVPTSWQGTSFGIRNTRTGVRLQFRSISGTATVEIFKDGSLETTLSVPDNTTTTQTYADDTSDPEYQIFSDLPIVGFKSSNAGLADTHPLFPASREIYGFASSSGTVVKVEDYGSSASYAEFESDGTTSSTTTISTVRLTGGAAGD